MSETGRSGDRIQVLGLITARGGSKELPRKNLAPLARKPLIAHTIEAALGAKRLDRVIVSTDDQEIADVACHWGVEAPFLRPAELARDDTPHFPVLRHALVWLEGHEGYVPDYVMLLQPTSPLRSSEDIDKAVAIATERDADSVVSVYMPKQHPYWMKRLTPDGRVLDYLPQEGEFSQRHSLPPVYMPNGAIYLAKPALVLEKDSLYSDETYAYIMPPERSLDIDTALDMRIAELILSERSTTKTGGLVGDAGSEQRWG